MNSLMGYLPLKHAADWAVAFLLLPVAVPVVLLAAVLIVLIDHHPPFFLQKRTGKGMKPFILVKLRSMNKMQQITPLGSFLRKSGLDELPQLANILLGQMSFVGPRPLLPEYERFYTEQEIIRFTVRPGLTGPNQIQPITSWGQYLQEDVAYVRNLQFSLDLWILWRTFLFLLSNRKGEIALKPLHQERQ